MKEFAQVDPANKPSLIEPGWLWCVHRGDGPTLGLSVHAGHDVRPSLLSHIAITERERMREEDPYTDYFAAACDNAVYTRRSRFEVDLNRQAEHAVCVQPEDCWGLDVWAGAPPARLLNRARLEHEAFYDLYAKLIRQLIDAHGCAIIFDVHAYNHQRERGVFAPQEDNPDINIGTGSMDRAKWAHIVDAAIYGFRSCRVAGDNLDVRENVRFRGREIAAFAHQLEPDRACAIAIEVKKTFMDEWDGEIYDDQIRDLRHAFDAAVRAVRDQAARHG